MKKEIHPKYVECKVTCGCGNTWMTRSTEAHLSVEICSNCHPFFTGQQRFVDTAGRVEKFQKKYAWSVAKAVTQAEETAKKLAARPVRKMPVMRKEPKVAPPPEIKGEPGMGGPGRGPGGGGGRGPGGPGGAGGGRKREGRGGPGKGRPEKVSTERVRTKPKAEKPAEGKPAEAAPVEAPVAEAPKPETPKPEVPKPETPKPEVQGGETPKT